MPKAPQHILVWSEQTQRYELHTPGHPEQYFHAQGDPAFSQWLETHGSFAFMGQAGRLSVRVEARSRGDGYWYAYHKQGRRTRKRYLGPPSSVTFARLEAAAQALNGESTPENVLDAPQQKANMVRSMQRETSPGSLRQDEHQAMLLLTRFSIPRQAHALVRRERLLQVLDSALTHPLTLLSASAGWGKTTLLSSWASSARQAGRAVAWLTLDEMDNDSTRFWASVITTLQTCLPAIGEGALQLLYSPQSTPISTILTVLINELLEYDGELFLLLDDYQAIEEPAIHESLAFLLDHLPAQLHLILASRSDPDLPLARWRASGQLLEIRNRDLQLTPDETDTFLTRTLGNALPSEEVALLYQRTEGWIAGVQLAALALRKQEDHSAFLQAFTGSHRYLMDYIQQEILQRLPEHVHRFVLQIAVLPRMNADLCRAVTGEEASQALLETLERQNLFLIPLDEERCWYRLHDLFREVLLARFQISEPEHVQTLRKRAASFYEQQGEIRQAVAFALAAHDFSYAAMLMEQVIEEIWLRGEVQTLYRWMMMLPDSVVHDHARLVLTAALYLLNFSSETPESQQIRARMQVEQMLTRVERTLHDQGEKRLPTSEVEVHQRRVQLLRLWMNSMERYDGEAQYLLEQQMQQLGQDPDVLWQMIPLSVTFILYTTFWRKGGMLVPRFLEFKQQVMRTRDHYAILKVLQWLIMALHSDGQLKRTYQECLNFQAFLQQINGHPILAGYISLFQVSTLYQWNRLEDTPALIQQVIHHATTGQQTSLCALGYWSLAAHALAAGDLTGAHLAIQDLERLLQERGTRTATYYAPWAAALRARYWLATGDMAAASAWATQVVFSAENWQPHRITEFFAVVQVYQAHQQYDHAFELLESFATQLSQSGNVLDTLEFLAARVVVLWQGKKPTQSHEILVRLLQMTEPEGYLRVYLDHGEPMRQALQALLDTQSPDASFSRSYVSTLLAAFEQEQHKRAQKMAALLSTQVESSPQPQPGTSALIQPALVEPLTRREQEVLRLLAEGSSNQQIADALVIQPSTVKKHVSNLLAKLGAVSRTQAIAQARAASLL